MAEEQTQTENSTQEEQTQENSEQVGNADRYNFLNQEEPKEEVKTEEEDTKVEETKEETKEESKEETTKETTEEPKEEVDYKLDKDTITIGKDDKQIKLTRIDYGDGTFGLVPEDKKGGTLMQADYTRKTQDLADERKKLETEKAQYEAQKQYIETSKFIDEIGRPPLQPVSDPLKENGELIKDKEGNVIGVAYNDSTELLKAQKEYNDWFVKNTQLSNQQKVVKEQNLKMLEDFRKKYGDEEYQRIVAETGKYMNPYIFKELAPYPPDALELIRKGMNYDTDIEKLNKEIDAKIKDAVLKKVKELETKPKETKKTPSNQSQTTQTGDIHERYNWIQR